MAKRFIDGQSNETRVRFDPDHAVRGFVKTKRLSSWPRST